MYSMTFLLTLCLKLILHSVGNAKHTTDKKQAKFMTKAVFRNQTTAALRAQYVAS